MAAAREGAARDLPGDGHGHRRAPGRGARPRVRAALCVLRRAGRGRQARRRSPQRKRLRSSRSPVSSVFVVGATLMEGDAAVPVTFAVTTPRPWLTTDRKSTRLNSSHVAISYAVFCLKK